MTARGLRRPGYLVVAACVVFPTAILVDLGLGLSAAHPRSPVGVLLSALPLLPSVVLGAFVWRRLPASPVGPALAWLGTSPAVVAVVEDWGDTHVTSAPWPGSTAIFVLKQGFWVWNLAGFVALCLVFPDGLLTTPGWRRLPWLGVAAAVALNAAVSLDPASHKVDGRSRAGYAIHLPEAARVPELVAAFVAFIAVLVATFVSVGVRYRRAEEVARLQLRWLMFSAGLIPLLLGLGWIAEAFGVPVQVWGPAFLLTMLLAVPSAVAVAILRYDLYDIDRLAGSTLTWTLTSIVSALVFAGTVFSIGSAIGADSSVGVPTAAFVTALLLLPVHRGLQTRVDRLIDRERAVMLAGVDRFVAQVREGDVDSEAVEAMLRQALRDDGLRLLLSVPGGDRMVDVRGVAAPVGEHPVPLRSGGVDVGVITLSRAGRRARRQAADAAIRARLPIEVARLRLGLRDAVTELTDSRQRLIVASATERRRLERDLHDGAQQRIVATGMRLRSIQGQIDPDLPIFQELDIAVDSLQDTVQELRRLAHGLRPHQLDDGLAAGLGALVAGSPVPVTLTVADLDLPEHTLTTIYFVVAETFANALKHASAGSIRVDVARRGADVVVEVCDDGVGGARPGFGLTSVSDRVSALGGRVTVESPVGAGTSIRVSI